MSSWSELDEAVAIFSCDQLTVLQCTSAYPYSYEQVGLNVIQEMKERYQCSIGFSDHTLDNYASLASVSLGVSVIERHFTLSRDMYGSDAQHSLTPNQFKSLVEGVQSYIETCLHSSVDKNNLEHLRSMKMIFEKSLVAKKPLRKGEVITRDNIAIKSLEAAWPLKT